MKKMCYLLLPMFCSVDVFALTSGWQSEANPYKINLPQSSAQAVAVPEDGKDGFKPINVPLLENSKVNFELTPESTELLGDALDLSSGAVSFTATDVSIPGNFALDVALRRRHHDVNTTYRNTAEFGDWGLDLPAIQARFVKGQEGFWGRGLECSPNSQQQPPAVAYDGQVIEAKAYWGGVTLSLGASQEKLLTNVDSELAGYGVKYYTKNNIVISCYKRADGRGEGFKALAKDGTAYYFDVPHQVRAYLPSYPRLPVYNYFLRISKVVDRFGNSVSFKYSTRTGANGMVSNNLTSIESSDGRQISLFYEHATQPNLVTRVTANGRHWTYQYSDSNMFSLSTVTRPDGRSWTYGLYDDVDASDLFDTYLSDASHGGCSALASSKIRSKQTLTHPNGIRGDFYFESQLQGTSHTPALKVYSSSDVTYAEPRCAVTMSLVKKVLTGPGIDQTWHYRYSENPGAYADQPALAVAPATIESSSVIAERYNLTDLKTTTVTAPDSSITQHVFSRRYDYLAGNEVATRFFDIATAGRNNTLLRTVMYQFGKSATRAGVSLQGSGNREAEEYRPDRLLEKTYDHFANDTDSYSKVYSSFDRYGTAEVVEESNSFSSVVRKTVSSFLHDRNRWVLHLLTNEQVTQGAESLSLTNFSYYTDPSADADKLYLKKSKAVFGKLRESYDYHSQSGKKGLISKIGYPSLTSAMWVSFDGYKRGKAQSIVVPHRYNAGQTQQMTLQINDSGSIASVTDFNGNTTSYSYDALDRVTTIDPPGAFWRSSQISYDYSSPGFAVVQTLSKGSYGKINYYNGLLQLVRSEDGEWQGASLNPDSRRVVNSSFNHYGKPTFTSVPSRSHNETFGQTTLYDGLQRIISQSNTSNGDIRQSYAAKNSVIVTNGRQYDTRTEYLAYGSPATELATSIYQPESVTTSIRYNAANLPTRISQGGMDEWRVYNAHQELCLQKRPETGVKAMVYNAVGQVESYAEGLTGNASSCQDFTNNAAAWVSLRYDNFGDVFTQSFADGTASKTSTFDAVGNLLSLSSGAVNWTYQYNSANLLTRETLQLDQKSFDFTRQYNDLGYTTSLRYPNGTVVEPRLNALGEITSLSADGQTLASQVKYHPDGQLAELRYGNGLSFTQSLDSNKRPFERYVWQNWAAQLGQKYHYDAVNNIQSISDLLNATKTLTLSYDSLDRLKSASAGHLGQVNYSYDTLGNITQKQIFSTVNSYSYDTSTNRLLSAMNRNFHYDSRGNVLGNGLRSFQYNRANQLTNSGDVQYTYDGHGRRVKQVKAGQTHYSVYDAAGSLLYREYASGQATNTVYLGKQLLAELDGVASGTTAPSEGPKPSITLSLSHWGGNNGCLNCIPKIAYGYTASNANSCQGTLSQTSRYGAAMTPIALSGTSVPEQVLSYTESGTYFTLTVTCQGPHGSTTSSHQLAGIDYSGNEF